MRVTNKDMRPGIRLEGTVIRKLAPYMDEGTFRKANRLMNLMVGHWLSLSTQMRQIKISREDGTVMRTLIVQKRGKNTAPSGNATGLLWIHGGGYAIGAPEQDFIFADIFCERGDCVMVIPDYKNAMEAPYPAALDDCYLALKWMAEHAEELGINRNQLFVGGESAGGGLTAALTIYARDRGEINLAFQIPLYPMLDDRMETLSSQDNDAPMWNTKSNIAGWKAYLREQFQSDEVPVYAAPGRAENLTDLPPAVTYVGTIEPFHDETVRYVERLKQAGVKVAFREYKGCYHAFDMVCPYSKATKNAHAFLKAAFISAQKHCFAVNERKP